MNKIILAGILSVMAALALWAGSAWYPHLLAMRLLWAAESARSIQRYDEAARCYRLAFQREPENTTLLRSYADFLNETRSPGSLDVRLRIIQLDPNSASAKLDGAEEALRYRKLTLARRLLVHPSPDMRKLERYDDLVGWLLLLTGDLQGADVTWAKALNGRPGNKVYETNLSMVRLSSTDEAVRSEALKKIEQLALGDKPPLSALSALMVYSVRAPQEPAHLDAWLKRVRALIPPQNQFFPSYLNALRRWRPDRFAEELASYQKIAAAQPDTAMTAQNWMATTRLHEEFLAFRQSLPSTLQENSQSVLLTADVLYNLKRNDALVELLQLRAWNGLLPLKNAWLERIRRSSESQPDADAAMQKWSEIVDSAARSEVALGNLAQMAFTWGWGNEYAAVLWATVERIPSAAPDALERLYLFYSFKKDTAGLRRTTARQLELQPNDPNVQNNFAYFSFLQGTEPDRARKMIAEVCGKYPNRPAYLSTRALGLLKAEQAEEGIKLFKKVDIGKLRGSSSGVCYGLLLAAAGDRQANAYLENAERIVSLPEELEMVREARKRIENAAPATP